jgi:hypothetical protein
MQGWRRKLEASGHPGLQPIAVNLTELERLLTADESGAAAIGRLLTELGNRTEAVVASGTATPTADKLQLLSQLLTDQGRSVTEEAQRSTTRREAPGAEISGSTPSRSTKALLSFWLEKQGREEQSWT